MKSGIEKYQMASLKTTQKIMLAHLVFDVGLLVLVEVDLEEPGTVEPDADALAHDLGGVDEVVEDAVVHGHQGAAAGTLLLQLVGLRKH